MSSRGTLSESTCVLLADRHTLLVEGVRDLLKTAFNTLYIVGDDQSLREGAQRLHPTAIVVDLAIAEGEFVDLLQQLQQLSVGTGLITLTLHDQPAAARTLFDAGANAVVLKRCIARDLLDAVDAIRQGHPFVSPDIGPIFG